MPFFMHFQAVFSKGFSFIFLFFRSARKWPTSEFCNTLRVKTNISQGARLRRRSGEGEEELQKQHQNNIDNTKKNAYFSYFFRAGRPCSKNAPKMTSRRLSGTLPGTLWEPPGTPWEAQDDPKRRQERPRKAPGAAPGRPGADQKGLKSRPRLRGASGEPFWSHFGLILEPPEVDFRASGG